MVYCGKPSRGCQMCRTRRIKCDEGKPTCAQCAKSRRECPGYKDDFDLVFRNETQATERRAKKSASKARRPSAQAAGPSTQVTHQKPSATVIPAANTFSFQYEPGFVPSQTQELVQSAPAWVPQTPSVPLDQIATHFFFSNFVTIPHNGDSRGFLDYMIPLVNSDQSNKTLSLAFSAASLAALANRPQAKSLLFRAETQYNRAIRHVNQALRDPKEQKTDQTLAAVLLLGLFESIMSRRVSMTAWGSHIDGAVMIIKMRGKDQLKTSLGNALFNAVRSQMIVNSLATGKAPDWGIDNWMADAVGRDENADEVNRLAMKLALIRCELNEAMMLVARTPENIAKVLDLQKQMLDIEQGFQDWINQLPDVWRVRTVAWVDSVPAEGLEYSEVFPGKIELFTDIWIASTWNFLRVSRLFISGAIVRCAAWLHAPNDYRTTPEYASAARMGVDVITDLIAATPYHLGWTSSKEFQKEFGLAGGEGFLCGSDRCAPRSLGAFVWIWPMFSIYCSDFATDAQRLWAKGRLNYITDVMGLNQAGTLSGYQLRLPSMTVKRDQFAAAMMMAAQQSAAAAAATAQAAAVAAQAGTPGQPTPTANLKMEVPPNFSPNAVAASMPPSSPQPQSNLSPYAHSVGSAHRPSTASTSGYQPSAQSAPVPSTSTYPTSQSTYPPSNKSASNYAPSTISTSSPAAMPATPPVSAAMQLQFLNYMKTDATPDIELQKAHEEAEARQREVWERERKRKLEEERLERERMQRDAEEEAARRKEVLKLKREELIQQATGGDSMLAELIERYMAVKMFDTI